ncbi:MAG: hypothetical protein WC477_06865 [Patescibacteria group bacterium]
MSALERYVELDKKWNELKAAGKGDTPEEEALMCEMDRAWYEMSDAEKKPVQHRIHSRAA